MIITASPAHAAFPISVSDPEYFSLTIGAAVAPNIKINVPTNSAPNFRVRETSGDGKSVKQVLDAPPPHDGAQRGRHLPRGIDFRS